MYTNLNDAKTIDPIFAEGTEVKVWYVKEEFTRSFCMGAGMAAKCDGNVIDTNDMTKFHTLIGTIAGTGNNSTEAADVIASCLQGEYFSPNGEARNLISSLGLCHTSFMAGDVIQIGDKFYTVDRWTIKEFNNDTFKKD